MGEMIEDFPELFGPKIKVSGRKLMAKNSNALKLRSVKPLIIFLILCDENCHGPLGNSQDPKFAA
jgi:hypothetical protein